jgi:uncharacterized membrane protein
MSTPKLVSLVVMGMFYIFAGAMHFIKPSFYLALMPPWLPWHRGLVAVSGVIEVALGLLVLVPATRPYAAWGIIALLLAVFPANIHAAITAVPGAGGYVRLPLQVVFIAWAWWYT